MSSRLSFGKEDLKAPSTMLTLCPRMYPKGSWGLCLLASVFFLVIVLLGVTRVCCGLSERVKTEYIFSGHIDACLWGDGWTTEQVGYLGLRRFEVATPASRCCCSLRLSDPGRPVASPGAVGGQASTAAVHASDAWETLGGEQPLGEGFGFFPVSPTVLCFLVLVKPGMIITFG